MHVGIIGYGAIGQSLVKRLAAAGIEEITVANSRGPESLAPHVEQFDGRVNAGTVREAGAAELVVLAVGWHQVPNALAEVQDWTGRILIDATNNYAPPGETPPDLGGRTSSEIVASHAPGAKVVKAFNHLAAALLGEDPRVAGGNRALFYSGDDEAAKESVGALLKRLGYAGIDLGGLVEGGKMHAPRNGPLIIRNLIEM
ncbi:NAD(P)-binding domain-containing protein [Streptomyces sp. NBC_00178]|uniref:NADPH-dependent F420 reductase n=1 Tax=Streptomyces sp. NBC_00178 TaxID=2975672 RepID=UPI002E2DACC2|nr:NAD(P)-binding domain-containing protein [Streptomyces sp. NBC_00178]